MSLQARNWINNNFRGTLADPNHDAGLIERCLDLASQFGILTTDGDARHFFQSHSAPLMRASNSGRLSFAFLIAEVHTFSVNRGLKVPQLVSASKDPIQSQDLFGATPQRVSKVAARSQSVTSGSPKGKESDADYINEAALFGRAFGIIPDDEDEKNFRAHSERALRMSDVDDTTSSTPELLARYLQELSCHKGFGA
jgi:hypothetical protein